MDPEAAAPMLRIDHLTVRFGGKTVVDGFSLALGQGESAVVTGDSGCGKSTVLRYVLGFVSTFEGRIEVDGEDVNAASIWRLRTRMAYVSQEPQLGAERVREVLERPFGYRANAALRPNLSRVPELMDRLLLPADLPDKEMAALSGGEKQRIAIAAALLLGRGILLLDEPTSALDKSAREVLREASQAALAPTVASMATLGLVSLPGMMTGVILAGIDPVTAVKYQIAIMIAIFSGTAITVPLVIWLTMRSSFNGYGVLDRSIFT